VKAQYGKNGSAVSLSQLNTMVKKRADCTIILIREKGNMDR
jgi:hypothetical protein